MACYCLPATDYFFVNEVPALYPPPATATIPTHLPASSTHTLLPRYFHCLPLGVHVGPPACGE